MEKTIAYKIELDIKNQKEIIRILHAKNAFNDYEATMHALTFLSNLSNKMTIYEMYFNAQLKDPIALDNLLKLKTANNDNLFGSNDRLKQDYMAIKEAINRRHEESNGQRIFLKKEIKNLLNERSKLEKKRKQIISSLDNALPENQLKTLVANNDRKGVANLLRNYLPFEQMAPIEKEFWSDYLEIIQTPLPLSERIFTYRGINEDMIYSAIQNGIEINKEMAIKENKAFLMSTLIVKNQGSWNRRLRSLQTMNNKFIGTIDNSDEFSQSARITTMFQNHSINPQGSPFLSFTPDFEMATYAGGKNSTDFGSKRVSAFLIDPRLLQYNYVSFHDKEKEFLINLVTFPDELVGIWDKNYHAHLDPQQFLNEKLQFLLEEKYGKNESQEIIKTIYQHSKDFYAPVYEFNSPFSTLELSAKKENSFTLFLEKAMPHIPTQLPSSFSNCTFLIKDFL